MGGPFAKGVMEKAAAEIGPGGSTQADRIAQSKVIGATEHSQTELSSMKWEEGEATVAAAAVAKAAAKAAALAAAATWWVEHEAALQGKCMARRRSFRGVVVVCRVPLRVLCGVVFSLHIIPATPPLPLPSFSYRLSDLVTSPTSTPLLLLPSPHCTAPPSPSLIVSSSPPPPK